MNRIKRTISKEMYDRAQEHNGYLTSEDELTVFGAALCYGRGIYGARAYEQNGEYVVVAEIGSSCD